jgi:hypothetical protein
MSQELSKPNEPKMLSIRYPNRAASLAVLLLLALLLMASAPTPGSAEPESTITLTLIGHVATARDAPVNQAEVQVLVDGTPWAAAHDRKPAQAVHTDRDGHYTVELTLPGTLIGAGTVTVEISKPGFRAARQELPHQEIACHDHRCYVRMPELPLVRSPNPAFYLAAGIFVVVFATISLGLLHETIAAFLGASAMLGISYLAGTLNPDFWIIGFDRAVDFIDLDVIFLIMTLMVVVSIWDARACSSGWPCWPIAPLAAVRGASLSSLCSPPQRCQRFSITSPSCC